MREDVRSWPRRPRSRPWARGRGPAAESRGPVALPCLYLRGTPTLAARAARGHHGPTPRVLQPGASRAAACGRACRRSPLCKTTADARARVGAPHIARRARAPALDTRPLRGAPYTQLSGHSCRRDGARAPGSGDIAPCMTRGPSYLRNLSLDPPMSKLPKHCGPDPYKKWRGSGNQDRGV